MGLSRVQRALLGLACLSSSALAAIHPYNKEYFYAVGDAFIFRGGREGLYASTKEVSGCRPNNDRLVLALSIERDEGLHTFSPFAARSNEADGCIFQALEKWGNWGQIAPGVSNGQSEIKFTKLEFARPEPVAAQFDPDEGFTGK